MSDKANTRTVLERLQGIHYEADEGYLWADDEVNTIRCALVSLVELLMEQEELRGKPQ